MLAAVRATAVRTTRALVPPSRRGTRSNGRPSAARGEVRRRTGALAVKVGMLGTWDADGARVALTALHVDACRVYQSKTPAADGYAAVQLGAGAVRRASKARAGHCAAHGPAAAPPPRVLAEFRVSEDALLPSGSAIDASHFVAGQRVDVAGVTRGKGFQGPMKRWGFGGGRATHGVSKAHRSHGSMGGCQDPGRVPPGKKMAGRMGGRRRTVQNLLVERVDASRGLVFVRGAVPGAAGEWVRVSDAVKKIGPAEYARGDVPWPAAAGGGGVEAA